MKFAAAVLSSAIALLFGSAAEAKNVGRRRGGVKGRKESDRKLLIGRGSVQGFGDDPFGGVNEVLNGFEGGITAIEGGLQAMAEVIHGEDENETEEVLNEVNETVTEKFEDVYAMVDRFETDLGAIHEGVEDIGEAINGGDRTEAQEVLNELTEIVNELQEDFPPDEEEDESEIEVNLEDRAGDDRTGAEIDYTRKKKKKKKLSLRTIEITNIANDQPFGPFFVMSHSRDVPNIYTLGEPASSELATLAETGDPGPLVESYSEQEGVVFVDAIADGFPFFKNEPFNITIPVRSGHVVSIASMAINTNDCFVALDEAELRRGEEIETPGLDSGTEENNELCVSIPGPACFGTGNEASGNGEGVVHVHRGFHGVGDLPESVYDWRNPMMSVSLVDSVTVVGALFTSTNSATNNEVLMFHTGRDGSLIFFGRYQTGGLGSGPGVLLQADPLASQNAVVASDDGRALFVVNARSNTVTSFRVGLASLTRMSIVHSGGEFPNSIAVHDNLLYVMNAGGNGTFCGYFIMEDGSLELIPDSLRQFDANQGAQLPPDQFASPSQIEFTPDGSQLLISIKDGTSDTDTRSGRLVVFNMNSNGSPAYYPTRVNDLGDVLPFGLTFLELWHSNTTFLMTEIASESVSSYDISSDGTLEDIETVSVGQMAPTRIVHNGDFAYVSNYGNGSISSLSIGYDGDATLLDSVAAEVPSDIPLDISIGHDCLFVLLAASGSISSYVIEYDGNLTFVGNYGDSILVPPVIQEEGGTIPPYSSDYGGANAGLAVVEFNLYLE